MGTDTWAIISLLCTVCLTVFGFLLGQALKILREIRDELKQINTSSAKQGIRIEKLEDVAEDHEERIRTLENKKTF